MDAVALALLSAALFGAMTVALRFAIGRGADAELGALATIAAAFLVALAFAVDDGFGSMLDAWPFALAGIIGPGASQLFFTLAIREAGPARTSVAVGTAPLLSVAIALVFLDEPLEAPLVLGALAIVVGGVLLVSERARPAHVRLLGLGFALVATVLFATRDNLLRWLSLDTEVPPALAACATLAAGGATVAAWLLLTRSRPRRGGLRRFAAAGVLFGLSYVALFEAYYRGRVTVVSPLVATESLWGVALSAVFLRRHELVGPRLVAGAALVVAGGALIGAFR